MKRINNNQFRRGAVLLYSLYLMIIMMAILSLAVDFGRCQMIKTELQRTADAMAHAALEQYIVTGSVPSTGTLESNFANNTAGSSLANPIDYLSGVTPTITVTWGWWKTSTKTFTANASMSPTAGYQQAIKIVVSRSAANGNAVPLTFPMPSGKNWIHTSVDIWASSIAMLNPPVQTSESVSALYNPWLAGMPVGSTLSYGTSTPGNDLTDEVTTNASTNDGPPLTMDVVPGTVLTFTNVSGDTSHDPQMGNIDGPDGEGSPWTHMQDSPDGNHNGEENNIQTLTAPLDSLVGVFLGGSIGSAPTAANAPSVYNDYMTQDDSTIQVQEPFYIGDGTPYSNPNVTAQFVVPKGATQLFLGTMDGYQWNNNAGAYSVTITQEPTISLVQ
jgi:Flp pilus assembly protein TadG